MSNTTNTLAAIDLGSNSFHLVVARVDNDSLRFVDRRKEMVRLGGGLDADKRLDSATQERGIECLKRFGERVRPLPAGSVRAVGTNTLRNARNAADFLARGEAALGHRIDIVSGIEEARLVYLGVSGTLADPSQQRLVMDIGGGSTEIIVGQSARTIDMESLYLGCVSMSRRFFDDGALTSRRWRQAELAARQELRTVAARFQKHGWEEAVGSSGTIRAVRDAIVDRGWSDSAISRSSLKRLRDHLLEAGHIHRLDLPTLSEERRPVFAGGVAVLLAAFNEFDIEQMEVSAGALREGLLYDLVGRLQHRDPRLDTVRALSETYGIDQTHALRVRETASHLLDGVARAWNLGDEELAKLLSWASELHEAGLAIAHSHYHRHGEYLLRNGDLFGFTRREQSLLATLVRAHRRKFPSDVVRSHQQEWHAHLRYLSILLRLAVLLHRNRREEEVPVPALSAAPNHLELRFAGGYLDEHPLTRADLDAEAELLREIDFTLEFS